MRRLSVFEPDIERFNSENLSIRFVELGAAAIARQYAALKGVVTRCLRDPRGERVPRVCSDRRTALQEASVYGRTKIVCESFVCSVNVHWRLFL